MIYSRPTGVTLTGEDAEAFGRFLDAPPNPKAIQAVRRGVELAKKLFEQPARDIRETVRDTFKRFPKTMEALRQSELRERTQPE